MRKITKLSKQLETKYNLVSFAKEPLWIDPISKEPVIPKFENGDLVRDKYGRMAIVISYAFHEFPQHQLDFPIIIHYVGKKVKEHGQLTMGVAFESTLTLMKSRAERLKDK